MTNTPLQKPNNIFQQLCLNFTALLKLHEKNKYKELKSFVKHTLLTKFNWSVIIFQKESKILRISFKGTFRI